MDYNIRKAKTDEKPQIARTIAYSFEKDFTGLSKDMERIAKTLENGIDTDRFFVAEREDKIVGIIACADCTSRAVYASKKDCRKHLGFIRGFIAHKVFTDEFMLPLEYPITTGVIEVVGVLEEARGKGIAKAMLKEITEQNPQYSEFVLNVTDINAGAIKLYENFGFVEYERVPYKWAKQAGFKAKIWMKYKNHRNEDKL